MIAILSLLVAAIAWNPSQEQASASRAASAPRRLALLIGRPAQTDPSMHDDLEAMRTALSARGYEPGDFLTLEGILSRELFQSFLKEASRRTRNLSGGELFIYYSGNGTFTKESERSARAGLSLGGDGKSEGQFMYWDEVFETLRVPDDVACVVLPDC
jgi:hypothetical protein